MRPLAAAFAGVLLMSVIVLPGLSSGSAKWHPGAIPLRTNSLCTQAEYVVFSCAVRQTGKIVSLCGSRDLGKERGYLQYRFGLPAKLELEFPKDRTRTQQQFNYSHYFRAQVDLTEIKFNLEGYEYSVFDT